MSAATKVIDVLCTAVNLQRCITGKFSLLRDGPDSCFRDALQREILDDASNLTLIKFDLAIRMLNLTDRERGRVLKHATNVSAFREIGIEPLCTAWSFK